jgi:hypothetical protein
MCSQLSGVVWTSNASGTISPVEHRPVATDEVHLLLIEPVGTPNTGDVTTAATKEII